MKHEALNYPKLLAPSSRLATSSERWGAAEGGSGLAERRPLREKLTLVTDIDCLCNAPVTDHVLQISQEW
jgi:hypothetical protein